MLANLDATKELGCRIRDVLEAGRPDQFGALMHEHWERKRARSSGMSNASIDRWYEKGLKAGALGGKLVEARTLAGLMFYAENPGAVRAAMSDAGLLETRFTFDLDGSVVIVRD